MGTLWRSRIMDNLIERALANHFDTYVDESDNDLSNALLLGQNAIYQIEIAIADLKEADQHRENPEGEVKFRSMMALAVVKQLEAFLESLTIAQKESTEKSNNTT